MRRIPSNPKGPLTLANAGIKHSPITSLAYFVRDPSALLVGVSSAWKASDRARRHSRSAIRRCTFTAQLASLFLTYGLVARGDLGIEPRYRVWSLDSCALLCRADER